MSWYFVSGRLFYPTGKHKINHSFTSKRYQMYKEKKVEEEEREEEESKIGSRKRGEKKILFDPEKSILKF